MTAVPGRAPPRAARAFWSLADGVARLSLLAGGAALAALAMVSIYQVVTRFAFDSPSSWSEVVARSLMVWSVFLCAPAVIGRGELMAFDFLRRQAPARIAAALHLFVGAATVAVLLVLAIQGTNLTMRASSQSLAGLEFLGAKVSWVYAAIPLGAALSILAAVSRMSRVAFEPDALDRDPDLEDAA